MWLFLHICSQLKELQWVDNLGDSSITQFKLCGYSYIFVHSWSVILSVQNDHCPALSVFCTAFMHWCVIIMHTGVYMYD